jgi:hypothetical protein
VAFLGLIDTAFRPGRIIPLKAIPLKAIPRYIQTLRSKRSIQDVLATVYESFISRFIDVLVYRPPIARKAFLLTSPVLTSRFAHSFKRRLCAALTIKYWSQWSPSSLEIPTTFFHSDDLQLRSEYDFEWVKVCTCLTVIPVVGKHETIFDTPQREFLTDCFIREIMSSVQRSS